MPRCHRDHFVSTVRVHARAMRIPADVTASVKGFYIAKAHRASMLVASASKQLAQTRAVTKARYMRLRAGLQRLPAELKTSAVVYYKAGSERVVQLSVLA